MKDIQNNSMTQTNGAKIDDLLLSSEIKDLTLLIMPEATPSVWESCARIISQKSDTDLEEYLDIILEWLQDLNWPGALIILNRLKVFSGEKLISPFIKVVIRASRLNTEEGLMWLDYLSELLDNEELKIKLPKTVMDILQKHYKNWGFWYDV